MEDENMEQIRTLLRKIKEGTIMEEEELLLEYLLIDQVERFIWEENLSLQERALLDEWERERLFLQQTEHFMPTGTKDVDPETRAAWDTFAGKMHFPVSDTKGAPEVPELPEHQRPKRLKQFITFSVSVAAIIAIAAGIFLFQSFNQPVSYYADGTSLDFRLPDNTHIIMNEGSELILSSRFNKRSRSVKMSGEIFFDVARNPEKPFIIKHGELTTQVKGTSFTIRDYSQLDDNTVIVNTGIVQVRDGRKEIALLTPNNQLSYNKTTGQYAVNKVDATTQSAWTIGRIVLRNASEKELALRIMQRYGKHLVIEGRAMGDPVRVYSEFNTETQLEDLLQSLSMAYDSDFRIKNDTVVIYPNPHD
ncbi:MAG TPA: hypothetical protein DDZ78_11180 [Porphyromonadaceae bacterium]|nr:hypothetical protein [Porphyromonadaceae bacterium]